MMPADRSRAGFALEVLCRQLNRLRAAAEPEYGAPGPPESLAEHVNPVRRRIAGKNVAAHRQGGELGADAVAERHVRIAVYGPQKRVVEHQIEKMGVDVQ